MQRFDNNGDGRLTFSEFSSAFLPMDLSTASMVQARRGNVGHFPRHEIFVGVTRDSFITVLRQIINAEGYAEKVRQRL